MTTTPDLVTDPAPSMTLEEFDRFVMLPENHDHNYEYIAGRIVEVVSNNKSSMAAAALLAEMHIFSKRRKLGWVTGADGGYQVLDQRYIPDAAFISLARQPAPSADAYYPLAPDIAVEVLSPTNSQQDIRIKIVNYLRAGTTVWLVDPELKQVEVYRPNIAPLRLGVDDTLDGGSALPGFQLKVAEIFA